MKSGNLLKNSIINSKKLTKMETEFNYKGFTVKITPDEFNDKSPDDCGNTDVFLVYDHRDFCIKRDGFDPEDIYEAIIEKNEKYDNYWYFPVFAYIHSGISLSLKRWFPGLPQSHNEFDVSFKGFILAKDEFYKTSEEAYEVCKSEINTWNDYLSGNVWNYCVYDNEENIVDSVCGFYGNPEKSGIIGEAKNSVDCEIRQRMKKRINQIKTFIKNSVPYEKRQELILSLF
jgi:hypothetical protein